MPVFCVPDADLDAKAADLRRDLMLAVTHLWTLPLILGSPTWLLCTRYKHSRPYSELNPLLYPYEMTRIVAQTLLTIGFILPLLFVIILAILLHEIRIRRPLYLIITYLPLVFKSHIISVSSPVDKPATPASDMKERWRAIRDYRMLLHDGKLFINRTNDNDSAEVWFYVNGVAEQGAMVAATCTLLRKLTGRMVNPYINTSHGVPMDLMECIVGRSLNCASKPAHQLVDEVTRQLSLGRRVVLVGHSQGGIILSNVVNSLVDAANNNNLEGLRRLEVYTFASAADEFTRARSGPFAEHFATDDDFVSRIGVLEFSDKDKYPHKEWNGTVYRLKHHLGFQGHLVKEMILPAMKKGLFANESVFWRKYCTPNHASYVGIDHHRVEVSADSI